jgi:hypothetical protein
VALRTFSSMVFATNLARFDNSCHGSPYGSSDESAGAGLLLMGNCLLSDRTGARISADCMPKPPKKRKLKMTHLDQMGVAGDAQSGFLPAETTLSPASMTSQGSLRRGQSVPLRR